MKVIDTHGHFVPTDFGPCPVGTPEREWPTLRVTAAGHGELVVDGKVFRTFEPAYLDISHRLAELDAQAIDVQLISPLPELLGYWLDPQAGVAMADLLNREIARAAAAAPERLIGVGALPLADIARSVEMVAEASSLGLRGILAASNVNGVSLADARFLPVLEAMEAHGLALFVHGYRPAGTERLIGSPLLGPVVGVPGDCAALIASMITTDVLGRFPSLRLCFMHGGGTFGSIIGRMTHVWRSFPDLQAQSPVAPNDYARRFFYDSITFDTRYLRFLIETLGAGAIVAGTDGPTRFGQMNLKAFILEACEGDAGSAAAILSGNCERLLGITPV